MKKTKKLSKHHHTLQNKVESLESSMFSELQKLEQSSSSAVSSMLNTFKDILFYKIGEAKDDLEGKREENKKQLLTKISHLQNMVMQRIANNSTGSHETPFNASSIYSTNATSDVMPDKPRDKQIQLVEES